MAEFIIQDLGGKVDIDLEIVKGVIVGDNVVNRFTLESYEDLCESVGLKNTDEIRKKSKDLGVTVPVGSIEFVTKYLCIEHGFVKENPIEIPKYLRTSDILNRDYTFMKYKDIPNSGNYFVKDVNTLKSFAFSGDVSILCNYNIHPDTLVELSSLLDIVSEYRVYVINNNIEAIVNYNGDCKVFPDMKVVNKIVSLIMLHEKWLKSFTVDVIIDSKGLTSLVEVHNFTSVGLYTSLWGSNLLYGYIQGIDYLLNDNKSLEV